jgi:peptidoglycan/LPS O-acetylase OafA/YrhL
VEQRTNFVGNPAKLDVLYGPKVYRRPLPALTGLRFLAAMYVVLTHSQSWLNNRTHLPGPIKIFLGNGYLAVSLFFLLSGFLLAYTYEGQIVGWKNTRRFWEARFARIYPVYLFSLLLAYLFQRGLNLQTQLAVLTMTQAWNPRAREITGAWNYPAWTLSVEAFFYLTFPFVMPWISQRSTSVLRSIGIALMALTVLVHTPLVGLNQWPNGPLGFVPLPIWRLPEFGLGLVLGLYFLRRQLVSAQARDLKVIMIIIVVFLALSLPLGQWVSLVIIPFSALVYELSQANNWLATILSTRLMVLLGGASYAIYLLQYPVRGWVKMIFLKLPGAVQPLGAPLTPIILILFSLAVFVLFEEPARKILRIKFSPSEGTLGTK